MIDRRNDHLACRRMLFGWRMPVACALAIAVTLSACASDGDASSDEETLGSFMGWGADDDPEAFEARFREQQAQVEESVRACMVEEGFEYMIPPEGDFGMLTVSEGGFLTFSEEGQDEEERVRTQGFGITTGYGDDGMADQFAGIDDVHDPNQEIVDAMSDVEREAYYEALHGSEDNLTVEVDEETGQEAFTQSGFGGGCYGAALTEVYGDLEASQRLRQELEPAFEDLYARVQADPRVVEWNADWSRCMADAGYSYDGPEAMHQHLREDFDRRLNEIKGSDGGFADPFAGWSESETEAFFEESTQQEIDAFFQEAQRQQAADVDQDALAALQQEEIDLAVADYECRDGASSWELFEEVRAEYEATFIEDNRGRLEELRELEGG